jgi:aspartate/methionine/tyrosine aminotransferase
MEFAKTRQAGRYTLATSGIANCPLSLLPVTMEDLSLDRPGGYAYRPLQQALAAHNGVDPGCVVHATGTSMANHLAMAALVEPDDDVLIEMPAYELIIAAARYLRVNIRRFARRPEDGWRVNVDEVRRQLTSRTKLIVLTNLHNPTSTLIDEATLLAVGGLAREAGGHVLVDEVYLEALFEDAPHSSFHLGPEFVVSSSLTKVYGLSGIRCGWILAAPELAWKMSRLNDLFGVVPAHPAERMSVIALANLGPLRERTRAILTANRPALNAFLACRNDLESQPLQAGTVAFPRLKSGRMEEFSRLLRKKYETTIVPGHYFDMPDHFRIGIGGEPAMTAEGLRRLGLALDEMRG